MSSGNYKSIPTNAKPGGRKLQAMNAAESKPRHESESESAHVTSFRSRWHWWNFIRCFLFLLVEAGYIAFAGYLLNHTVLLPDPRSLPKVFARFSPSTDTIKSAIGAAFNIWHTVAGLFATDVFFDAFSREWSIVNTKPPASDFPPSSDPPPTSNPSSPPDGPLDQVSTLTSGLWDQLLHVGKGSSIFHFTLAASSVLFILVKLGPSTIVVENAIRDSIQVGGLLLGTSASSHFALQTEIILEGNFGYTADPNWIIPRPAQNASLAGGSIDYFSDVISFRHSCDWYTPLFGQETVEFGGEAFRFPNLLFAAPAESRPGSGVFPIHSSEPTRNTSAFLLFGGNSSFPLETDPLSQTLTEPHVVGEGTYGNTIDLGQLPALHHASWFNFTADRFKTGGVGAFAFRAPLATGLLCDAHAVLTTRRVELTSNRLTVDTQTDRSRVGNINETDIPKYFALALDGVGNPQDHVMTLPLGRASGPITPEEQLLLETPLLADFTPLAVRLLLPEITFPIRNWVYESISPLPLPQIAANMDHFFAAVSKAQNIDGGEGFSGNDLLSGGSSSLHDVPAKIPTTQQILTTSRPWFWLTVTTTVITFFSCLWIALQIETAYRHSLPLNINNVLSADLSAPMRSSK